MSTISRQITADNDFGCWGHLTPEIASSVGGMAAVFCLYSIVNCGLPSTVYRVKALFIVDIGRMSMSVTTGKALITYIHTYIVYWPICKINITIAVDLPAQVGRLPEEQYAH
jgi:hypothetical protein